MIPDVVRDVEIFQERLKSSPNLTDQDLERRLVLALINERLKRFIQEKSRIGPIDSPEKVREYVSAVADLGRDYISIHPFRDGNGRTSRLLMNWLLQNEKIPPARLFNPDLDIQATEKEWEHNLLAGVMASIRLQRDLNERLLLGLPLSNSPELVSPYVPRSVSKTLKIQGSEKRPETTPSTTSDPKQYGTWLRMKLKQTPSLRIDLATQPNATGGKLFDEFEHFESEHHVDYQHKEKGLLKVDLNLTDPDYEEAFGHVWAGDTDKWKLKKEIWGSDQLIFRGVTNRNHELSEDDILQKFVKIDPAMASNRIAGQIQMSNQPKARNLAVADFENYNRDVFENKLT